VRGYVSIHSRPVKALHQALLGFVDTIVPCQKFTMGLGERLRDESGRQEEYYTARLELSLDATPDEPIFYKTVI
jgi:hypothetical protein